MKKRELWVAVSAGAAAFIGMMAGLVAALRRRPGRAEKAGARVDKSMRTTGERLVKMGRHLRKMGAEKQGTKVGTTVDKRSGEMRSGVATVSSRIGRRLNSAGKH